MSENMTIDVVDIDGKKSGTTDLPADVFGVQVNIPLIHQVVVAQLAAARQGTHKVKGRGEVSGGGAKPWRQKGTGRARQGSRRSPQWVGGGVVHGPTPRDYAQRTPKKMVAAALRGALSDRARDGRVHVISELVKGETPSTKAALSALSAAAEGKVLVVLHRDEDLAWLSLRNAPSVHALAVDQLNAYDVLCNDSVVFTAAALQSFLEGPAKGRFGKAVARESELEPSNAELAAAELVIEEDTAEPSDSELEAEADAAIATLADYGTDSFRGENPPAGFDIKGNEDSMKFHTTESPYYDRTVAEVWFNSVEAAEAAGFANVQGDAGADDEESDK